VLTYSGKFVLARLPGVTMSADPFLELQ
jgi:hypothetical protein